LFCFSLFVGVLSAPHGHCCLHRGAAATSMGDRSQAATSSASSAFPPSSLPSSPTTSLGKCAVPAPCCSPKWSCQVERPVDRVHFHPSSSLAAPLVSGLVLLVHEIYRSPGRAGASSVAVDDLHDPVADVVRLCPVQAAQPDLVAVAVARVLLVALVLFTYTKGGSLVSVSIDRSLTDPGDSRQRTLWITRTPVTSLSGSMSSPIAPSTSLSQFSSSSSPFMSGGRPCQPAAPSATDPHSRRSACIPNESHLSGWTTRRRSCSQGPPTRA